MTSQQSNIVHDADVIGMLGGYLVQDAQHVAEPINTMRQYSHSMVERHLLFSSGRHIHELQRDAMSGTQCTKDFDPEDWTACL